MSTISTVVKWYYNFPSGTIAELSTFPSAFIADQIYRVVVSVSYMNTLVLIGSGYLLNTSLLGDKAVFTLFSDFGKKYCKCLVLIFLYSFLTDEVERGKPKCEKVQASLCTLSKLRFGIFIRSLIGVMSSH